MDNCRQIYGKFMEKCRKIKMYGKLMKNFRKLYEKIYLSNPNLVQFESKKLLRLSNILRQLQKNIDNYR